VVKGGGRGRVRGANNRYTLHGRAFDFVIHIITHVNNPILNEYGF